MSFIQSLDPGSADLDWLSGLIRSHCASGDLEAQRIFHGRGSYRKALAWLTVDAFAGWYYFVFHARPPDEIETWLQSIVRFCEPRGYRVACQYRYVEGAPAQGAGVSELPEQLWVKESGLAFKLRFTSQNCGLFFDAKTARAWVRENSSDKRVLNMFAYTCGYSVAAMAGGARACVNVDKSRVALAWGRDNHRHNTGDSRVHYLACDILKSWGRIGKFAPYDLVVVDPPSYQIGSFIARKDYVKVLRRLPALCAEQADILLALNAPELPGNFLEELVQATVPDLQFLYRLDLPAAFTGQDLERAPKFMVFRRCARANLKA